METSTQPQPPAFDSETKISSSQEHLNPQQTSNQPTQHGNEYDPCQNAQKFSPFYMYNHDSPRPSADIRPKQSIHVSLRDLEMGDITPSVTQEKMNAQKKPGNKFRFWERKQRCLTKPKKQWWLQRLPKKQRVTVKILIALLVAGTMVGIAVGIAAALHSGVYGSDKVVGQHEGWSITVSHHYLCLDWLSTQYNGFSLWSTDNFLIIIVGA